MKKEVIRYLIFGVLTTIISLVTFYISIEFLNFSTILSNIVSWILSVLFAYITNKKYVFESDESSRILPFFYSRGGTLIFEVLTMYILVDLFLFKATVIKLILQIVVVILNYMISKLYVFNKKP